MKNQQIDRLCNLIIPTPKKFTNNGRYGLRGLGLKRRFLFENMMGDLVKHYFGRVWIFQYAPTITLIAPATDVTACYMSKERV